PEQHFVKLVHRELVRLLGEKPAELDLGGPSPVVVMLVGLNGSGKTTTTAKLARWLHAERGRTPYLVPADVYRPAATLQLETLARELGVPVHPATAGGDAVAIAREGGAAARARGLDTVVVDTAGRQTVDDERIASRILGMGDVLSLIERAEKAYDRSQAEVLQKKLRRNAFDLEDFREQLRAVKKMGAVSELIGMIPGVKKMLRGADLSGAEDELNRVEAIINSMTRAERKNVQLLNASRRKRIARGSGTSVADVNRLIKQFTHTKKVLKQLGSGPMMPRIPGLPGLPR